MSVGRNPSLRGPWLAEIDLVSRVGGEGLESLLLPPLLLAYLDKFGSKPVCFSDLKNYISFIPDSVKEEFIKRCVQSATLSKHKNSFIMTDRFMVKHMVD